MKKKYIYTYINLYIYIYLFIYLFMNISKFQGGSTSGVLAWVPLFQIIHLTPRPLVCMRAMPLTSLLLGGNETKRFGHGPTWRFERLRWRFDRRDQDLRRHLSTWQINEKSDLVRQIGIQVYEDISSHNL